MTNAPIIPQDLASQKFYAAMNLFVGRGRRWSCVSVSEATGIPLRTIESYRAGQATPSLANYQALCSVLGQPFFAATVEHLPFEVSTTEPGDQSPQQVLTHSLGFSQMLANMLEDGRIDHIEEPKLVDALRMLREQVNALEARLASGAK